MSNQSSPTGNRLLDRLAPAEHRRLGGAMQPMPIDLHQVLYRQRAPIDHVYFPIRGTASALTVMNDGSAIEVATIGNEGVVGLGALLGDATSANQVVVQVAGK